MADYRIKFICDTCNGEGEVEGIIFECARDYTNATAIEEIL